MEESQGSSRMKKGERNEPILSFIDLLSFEEERAKDRAVGRRQERVEMRWMVDLNMFDVFDWSMKWEVGETKEKKGRKERRGKEEGIENFEF